MRPMLATLALGAALSVPPSTRAQVPDSLRRAAASAPLFASLEPLTFTIEAPLTTIFKERGATSEEFPGKLIVRDPDDRPKSFDVDLRTRGKARLRPSVCEFPPLRVDFDREDVASSVFEGQNRLKLSVHCQNERAEYEQYVLQEYLVYRVLNQLTDLSYRVRLARVTYVDTDKQDTLTHRAFFIEDTEAMAARNGWTPVSLGTVPPAFADSAYLALTEVFEYMIGNPDWSAFARSPDEDECCHNTQPIGDAVVGPLFPVAYDFDVTGIVNPRYADALFGAADRGLGITRVRQRVYRGLCQSGRLLPRIFQLFNEKKDAIYALYRVQPELDPKVRDETLKYLDEFYGTINDPRMVDREFTQKCRK